VKYYVVTNFSGFVKIIDILGGVTIDVESNMYHPDPDPNLNINLSKGVQVLNGQDALRYVRYRGGPTADIGRTGRQAQFITAVMDEMISTKTITRLPQLLPELMENIHTNIPVKELPTLLKAAQDFGSEQMITQTLPGYSFTDPKSGASYWQADEEITPGIIKKLFEGETFDVMSDPPDWVSNSAGSTQTQPEEVVEETPAEEDLENPEGTLPEGEDGSEDEIPRTEAKGRIQKITILQTGIIQENFNRPKIQIQIPVQAQIPVQIQVPVPVPVSIPAEPDIIISGREPSTQNQ